MEKRLETSPWQRAILQRLPRDPLPGRFKDTNSSPTALQS